MIDILIFTIGLTVFFLKGLYFLYLFQIKEYRFDRFFSQLKEEHFMKIFYSEAVRLPAKSPRNILVFILFLPFLYFYLFFGGFLSFFGKVGFLLLTPILSFCLVFFLVEITSIFTYFYRQFIINKAKKIVKKSKVKFIGITGSYGKTSTKEFLYQLLFQNFRVAKTEANINTDIGVSLSVIKNLGSKIQYFIVEMGAYKIGEITAVCKITPPTYAVLTGIGNQHLGLFGSKENLLLAKSELLEAVPQLGKIYINLDSYPLKKFQKRLKGEVITFSAKDSRADIFIKNTSAEQNKIQAIISYKSKEIILTTKIIGTHNITNLLPCLALAMDLEIPEEIIIKTVEQLENLSGKLSHHQGLKSSLIFNDSGNSNVEGFISAIVTIDQFPLKNKIILTKGIIELGKDKNNSYQKIINQLNQTKIILYTTDSWFKVYDKKNHVVVFSDEKEMFKETVKLANKNCLILIEGKFTKDFINKLCIHTI